MGGAADKPWRHQAERGVCHYRGPVQGPENPEKGQEQDLGALDSGVEGRVTGEENPEPEQCRDRRHRCEQAGLGLRCHTLKEGPGDMVPVLRRHRLRPGWEVGTSSRSVGGWWSDPRAGQAGGETL